MARILVVDDDPDILKIARQVLSRDGHMVYTVDAAIKAMDQLRETMFDLLISDANMPHFTGFELVQTLRRDNRYRHMAICMLTGLREKKDIEKAIKVGVDDYIVKPIDPILLSKKVTALFEKRQPADHPEIHLQPGSPESQARVRIPTTVLTISELGVKILSDRKMEEGSIVEINCDLFDNMMIEVPPLRVLTCTSHEGRFVVQLIFFGAREAFLQKVRSWIYSHGSMRRTA